MKKIVNLECVGYYRPEGCSCGTGYDEYHLMKVIFDNNTGIVIRLSTWYCSDDMICENFKKHRDMQDVSNVEEFYSTLLKKVHEYDKNK